MSLSEYVHTFGQAMVERYGQRVHKLAIDAGFTCPNRDGSKGSGGCTFCNNHSFSPHRQQTVDVAAQIEAGRRVIAKRTRARRFIAYFQAYTNTYDDPEALRRLYDQALAEPDVVGLAIGTRPDCVPPPVLDLLACYRMRGHEVWLELGLQSAFDSTLALVNRGHGYAEYRAAVRAARARGIPVCTHLIVGLPGETAEHARVSLERVLEEGVDGLKLHPLHVVAVVPGGLRAYRRRSDRAHPGRRGIPSADRHGQGAAAPRASLVPAEMARTQCHRAGACGARYLPGLSRAHLPLPRLHSRHRGRRYASCFD